MEGYYTKDPKEILFWRETLQEAGLQLVQRIEELRNHVTDTSKRDTFYVYFHWREVSEREYYQLKLALAGVLHNYKDWLYSDNLNLYLFNLLADEISRNRKRFQKTKFFWFFNLSLGFFVSDEWLEYKGFHVIPIREYLGNYAIPLRQVLQRVYTVRYNTPRRIKQKVFRRGYDDKGSASSVSERARRSANTEEFPYLTKDFLEYLRNIPDPIGKLRSLGYLQERRE
jgi:hypothetical protein